MEIDTIKSHFWDVIVIGTGVGGATIGYALAKAGKKVLFCEKGRDYFTNSNAIKGCFAEDFYLNKSLNKKDILKNSGRYWGNLIDTSKSASKKFKPFLGMGIGGSSAIYGGVLERFSEKDFSQGKWPFTYDEIKPYYAQAEKIYNPNFSIIDNNSTISDKSIKKIYNIFIKKGLKPYKLNIAHAIDSDCNDCQSMLCRNNSKFDSARACVYPSLKEYGATLLTDCEVKSIKSIEENSKTIEATYKDQNIEIKGKIIILAAGALISPMILLNSKTSNFPNGLGNTSNLVGKNLMRHFIDLYVIPNTSSKKELATNHLYDEYGTIQSFGKFPPSTVLVEEIASSFNGRLYDLISFVFRKTIFLPNFLLSVFFNHSAVLATIAEDEPNINNKVFPINKNSIDFENIKINYTISKNDRKKIKAFRKKMKNLLKGLNYKLIKQSENNKRLAHICGTLKYGETETTGVVNKNNEVYGVKNLYVTDSSFFPTSGSTNPSLTIAANALRVAKCILEKNSN